MPVRFRITFLFTLAVFIILGILCLSVYYFSAQSRVSTIKKRLTNRAITTARFLRHSDVFDTTLVHRIDSLTSLALKGKSVEVFNEQNQRIYHYSDVPSDNVNLPSNILDMARESGIGYFSSAEKEVVVYSDTSNPEKTVIVSAAEDADGNESLGILKKILASSFIAGVVASFVAGLFFSGRLLRPVRKITGDITEISAYNLERRIETGKNKDEWYELSSTLNQLFDRLKSSFELQRRFISNASHELSTPLTLIGTQLEVALQRNRTEDAYRQAMQTVLADVRHMSNLVQTLLQFASTSGNPGGLDIEPLRIDEILMQLPADVQKQDNRYAVSLQFDHLPEQEEQLLLFGNERLLYTAIRNVVINACKYSPDHHARIRFEPDEKNFIITIEDNGPGMKASELEYIFQPFYRIREHGPEKGFGLGLSLTYQILKMHKGTIQVQSVVGKGTTFTIGLPAGILI